MSPAIEALVREAERSLELSEDFSERRILTTLALAVAEAAAREATKKAAKIARDMKASSEGGWSAIEIHQNAMCDVIADAIQGGADAPVD